ncbi:MAG: hypothetical protein FJ100_10510 [Deltaproteobacteria bacterium]|nr:hypothetical protein [Deltaproteobacteria bacterium]
MIASLFRNDAPARWVWAPVVAIGLALTVAPARAIDKQKAAAAMAEKAAQAFESGDAARASDLYYEAWRADPTLVNALYNSARAAQVAGRLEVAEERFGQFVAAPGAEAAQVAKARAWLREIGAARLQVGMAAADAAERQSPAEGYLRWLELAQRHPDEARLWLRAGLCADKAGLKKEAVAALAQARDRAAAGSGDRAVAEARLVALAPSAKPAAEAGPPATRSPAPTPTVAVTAAEPPQRWPWLVAAAGAVVAGTGAVLSMRARADRADFEAKMAPGFAGGKVPGTRAAAQREADEIAGRQTLAAVAGGAGGIVAAAAVAWVLVGQAQPAPAKASWWWSPGWDDEAAVFGVAARF